jgi:hypothetical protein
MGGRRADVVVPSEQNPRRNAWKANSYHEFEKELKRLWNKKFITNF